MMHVYEHVYMQWLLQDKAIVLQRLKSDSDTNGKSSESGEGSEGSAGMDRLLRVYVIRKDGKVVPPGNVINPIYVIILF